MGSAPIVCISDRGNCHGLAIRPSNDRPIFSSASRKRMTATQVSTCLCARLPCSVLYPRSRYTTRAPSISAALRAPAVRVPTTLCDQRRAVCEAHQPQRAPADAANGRQLQPLVRALPGSEIPTVLVGRCTVTRLCADIRPRERRRLTRASRGFFHVHLLPRRAGGTTLLWRPKGGGVHGGN